MTIENKLVPYFDFSSDAHLSAFLLYEFPQVNTRVKVSIVVIYSHILLNTHCCQFEYNIKTIHHYRIQSIILLQFSHDSQS